MTPRERILEAADRLFYADGLRATGVDTVIAEAGVAKMTLYAHFKSKDELIAEYLRRRGAATREWLAAATERHAARTGDRVEGLFAALKDWFSSPEFRGCALIRASAELADPAHPGRAAVAEHERLFAESVTDLLRKARVCDPEVGAAALGLIINGAIVAVAAGASPAVADVARAAALKVLGRKP